MSDSRHTHAPGDQHSHSHGAKLQPVQKPHDHASHGGSCCSSAAAPALVKISEAAPDGARLSRFRIEAMDCPTEQTLIQNKLGKLAGVQQLEFNLINRVLGVTPRPAEYGSDHRGDQGHRHARRADRRGRRRG